MKLSVLFESTFMNTMALANRFIRSATWEGLADNDGSATQKLTEMLGRVSGGGVALVITLSAQCGRRKE
jgi:2,4-dienoyl-CoA reductase-like NADH-dependent reductase (Old Yellow Enzyme family)